MRLPLEALGAQLLQRCVLSRQCGPSIFAVSQRHEWGEGPKSSGWNKVDLIPIKPLDTNTEKETEGPFFFILIADQPVSHKFSFPWFGPASRINLSFY